MEARGNSAASRAPDRLGRALGRGGYFALAFGAIVGSGWVVVLGDWLRIAGPGGTVIGFMLGATVMALICLCYGELAGRFPTAGAEFVYTLETFGEFPGFLVGWFMTLYAVSVCAFEGIALAWLIRTLVPGINLGTAYTIAAKPVTWDALGIGATAALVVGALHYRSASATIRFQNLVTYGFIIVSGFVIVCGFSLGSLANLQPLFSPMSGGKTRLGGIFWIFSTCAFFLAGWQAALHAIEERQQNISPNQVVRAATAAIFGAALFYSAIVVAAACSVPWTKLLNKELPAAAAFGSLDEILGTVILTAAVASIAKTWTAVAWIGTRVLFAEARHGLLPASVGATDARTGAPRPAVVIVTGLTLMGVALGRGAILPIVNMVSTCLALSLILCLCVLLRRRRYEKADVCVAVRGGGLVIWVSLIGSVTMVLGALAEPFLRAPGTIPMEWLLLGAWTLVGILVWALTQRSAKRQEAAPT